MLEGHFSRLMLIALGLLWSSAFASEFRAFRPILTPAMMTGEAGKARGKEGYVIRPVPRNVAAKALAEVVDAWNRNNIEAVLGDEFFDRTRLNDAMNTKVPRDAKLSVLAVQDVQTLEQQVETTPSGKALVSTVSITARTQIIFNDPTTGFQMRDGTNDYIVRIRQRLR